MDSSRWWTADSAHHIHISRMSRRKWRWRIIWTISSWSTFFMFIVMHCFLLWILVFYPFLIELIFGPCFRLINGFYSVSCMFTENCSPKSGKYYTYVYVFEELIRGLLSNFQTREGSGVRNADFFPKIPNFYVENFSELSFCLSPTMKICRLPA